jgi:prepilin-type N-terminal cleavage/methylation domain-containing protein
MKRTFKIRNPKSEIGFTLIELLVVIAIIGILAAILLPTLTRAREMANRARCIGNLKDIGLAINLYADSNDGYYPYDAANWNDPRDSLVKLYPEYEPDFSIFICPSSYLKPAKTETQFVTPDPACATNTITCGHLTYLLQCMDPATSPKGFSEKYFSVLGGKSVALMMDKMGALKIVPTQLPLFAPDIENTCASFFLLIRAVSGTAGRESAANHKTDGLNVLYTGGNAAWVPAQYRDTCVAPQKWAIRSDELPTYGQYKFPDPTSAAAIANAFENMFYPLQ